METLENSQAASLNKTQPETRQDSTQAKFESWRNDPDFKMFVAEIVSEMRQLDRAESDSGQQTGGRELPNKGKSAKQNVNQGKDGQMAQIKSPSDTTIYKPAFRTAMENTNDAITKISNFVDGMRLDAEKGRHNQSPATKTSRWEAPRAVSEAKGHPRAKEAAKNVILDAEQFRAQIQQPRGGCPNIIQTHVDANHFTRGLDDDDQFFHVTCHIELSLKSKIERGDFIELDRLLPKDPSGAGGSYNQYDENKVELVSRGGHTYFKPIKETQINVTVPLGLWMFERPGEL